MKTHEKYLNEKVPNFYKKKIKNSGTLENVLSKIAEQSSHMSNYVSYTTEWDAIKKSLKEDISELQKMVDNCAEFIDKN